MGSVSSQAHRIRQSAFGTPRQARPFPVPLKGKRTMSSPSRSRMMGNVSSQALRTGQSASGTPRQARPSRVPLGGTRVFSPRWHSHMMGSMLSQAHRTRQSASGMPRKARQSPGLLMGMSQVPYLLYFRLVQRVIFIPGRASSYHALSPDRVL